MNSPGEDSGDEIEMVESECVRCGTVNRHRGEGIRTMCYECGIAFPTASRRSV